MFTNNPYAQGGWPNPHNPNGSTERASSSDAPPPSAFGALPSLGTSSAAPEWLTFYFTSFSPNILNCVIVGPSRKYTDVVTSTSVPQSTVFRSASDDVVAIIEWHRQPFVEIKDLVPRQTTAQFLRLSVDQSYREMKFRGNKYAWIPSKSNNNLFNLYNISYSPADFVARVSRATDTVTLQITVQAVHAGLMDVAIVATVLLFSGRNIT